ncbi:MAG: hypothetical protein ACOYXT_17580 [Bacteroidota bacterium]
MKIDNRDIFEQLGNLFYAVAADQHIMPLEVTELKALISKDWLPRNLNESVVPDDTHFILIAIDSCEGNSTPAKEAFWMFSKFYTLHPEVFSSELKQRILDTAVEIAKIFKIDNRFENRQLHALKSLVDFDEVKA